MRAAVEVFLRIIITALIIHTWLVAGLIVPIRVAGDSMSPSLVPDQRMLVDRATFSLRAPNRGEVIVLTSPDEPRLQCVKRIAGLPGEQVQIRGNELLIDGSPHAWKYPLAAHPSTREAVSRIYQLGHDEYFVLGDNTDVSEDSRTWSRAGIPFSAIVGKVMQVRK
jgi:signal peptidase I